jgi:hypothetical protein
MVMGIRARGFRRVGARSFGPCPSLSVTLAIVGEGPVCLGSGEELDAEINGCPDKALN